MKRNILLKYVSYSHLKLAGSFLASSMMRSSSGSLAIAKDPDEERIIEEAKKDPASFKWLYETYFKRIFLFIYHKVESRNEASDLTSQVFLKAMQRLHQYQSRGLPFSSWLYRIAIRSEEHTSELP